jgi:hypothetical protein
VLEYVPREQLSRFEREAKARIHVPPNGVGRRLINGRALRTPTKGGFMPQDDAISIELTNENHLLKQRNDALEAEIAFLKTHPALASGMRGAKLIAKRTGGAPADYAAKYDVLIAKIKIEVKFSKLNHPHLGSSTRRWTWSKPNGWKDKGKDYDFLLLIGDRDSRFLDQYPNDSSPYVFFLIPRVKVHKILTSGKTMARTYKSSLT